MNTKETKQKPFVLKDLIAEKDPRLANRIPNFVYRFLNRFLHVEEINDALDKYGHLNGIDFISAVMDDFNVDFKFKGTENLPKSGQYIFASNHPLGGFDGMLLLSAVTRHMGPSLFLVRDELTKVPHFKEVFIPINKFGSQRHGADKIKGAYESEAQILIFPSGLASRKINGKITDLKWHKHFIQKAKQYHRDVIPVHIDGKNSNRFYRIAKLRKLLGIKVNIEMFFLPDEMFRQRNKSIIITFGKPIPWQQFDKSKKPDQWAEFVKQKVYAMAPENQK